MPQVRSAIPLGLSGEGMGRLFLRLCGIVRVPWQSHWRLKIIKACRGKHLIGTRLALCSKGFICSFFLCFKPSSKPSIYNCLMRLENLAQFMIYAFMHISHAFPCLLSFCQVDYVLFNDNHLELPQSISFQPLARLGASNGSGRYPGNRTRGDR